MAAHNHFLENKANGKSFSESEAMMKGTYNCAVRNLQVVRLLEHLRFPKFVSGKIISDSAEGLKSLVQYNELLMPLTPTSYHHASQKVTFLRKGVVDHHGRTNL